ncbi:hypothetical protein LEP1GSC195_1778 [Leptospira wolbachii serovar Codice str. CDC]|uniref:Uncharacterized protein n=1 Tax=Leptospira wolbachii serovar Codice str. CDC TaxID=1218599 RepID=R8ZZW6_9LEPT|nr:hypothetical protein [Leptospira wolbachii]EOQ95526.1 hypothetical protein LEP1GSC195_1778 [Leptospira wolbachii serovar Codice str. CDC]
MKIVKIKSFLIFKLFLILFLIQCESVKRYSRNRIHDTADLFTIGIERGNIGANFFFWCLGGGLTISSRTSGIGMRDGHFGIYEINDNSTLDIFPLVRKDSPANKIGISNILINSSGHKQLHPQERTKEKDYQIVNFLTIFPIPPIPESKRKVAYCNSPVKIEGSLGLYFGVRFGFNLSELLDLITGYSTLDMLNDDETEEN